MAAIFVPATVCALLFPVTGGSVFGSSHSFELSVLSQKSIQASVPGCSLQRSSSSFSSASGTIIHWSH
jgi:hypothetical protein